jgi:hypothetical protein
MSEAITGVTVGMLKELLNDYPDDAVIRVAQQPSYPLRAKLTHFMHRDNSEGSVLWIATREVSDYNESPYAPRSAWDGDEIDEDVF